MNAPFIPIRRAGRRLLIPAAALCMTLLVDAPAARSSGNDKAADGQKVPGANRMLSNVTFVAFDTETTGLNPKKDRIVEIGAVKYRNGEIIEEKNWLIHPQQSIPWWSTKVHGISNKMVKDAPTFEAIYPEFRAFIKGAVLMAHNARFDIAFVNEEVRRIKGEAPDNYVVDSLGLFRTWYPQLKSHALASVAEHTKVSGDDFHRALADSIYVARIFNQYTHTMDPKARLKVVYADAGGVLEFQ
jgi:DNA polymerase-3 subunit alpha (Gram-positive type)